MKTSSKFLITLLLGLFISSPLLAQKSAKVIAVVNKADWCKTCKKNEDRAMAAFNESNKDGAVKFVINDLTDKETKAKSVQELEKVGLKDVFYRRSGNYFINIKDY